jgi:hypothetical protein
MSTAKNFRIGSILKLLGTDKTDQGGGVGIRFD